jgi:hypothetical protein
MADLEERIAADEVLEGTPRKDSIHRIISRGGPARSSDVRIVARLLARECGQDEDAVVAEVARLMDETEAASPVEPTTEGAAGSGGADARSTRDASSRARRWTVALTAVGVVIAGGAFARDAVVDGVLPDQPDVEPASPQRTATIYSRDADGAEAALLKFLDHRRAGEYDGVWEMYTEAVHQVISKEDFVKLEMECPTGRMYSVLEAHMESDDRAAVEGLYRDEKIMIYMSYVDSQWRVKPTSDQMQLWSRGLKHAISDLKMAYRC